MLAANFFFLRTGDNPRRLEGVVFIVGKIIFVREAKTIKGIYLDDVSTPNIVPANAGDFSEPLNFLTILILLFPR